MSKADEKRKIIEVYITENDEENTVSFEFEKKEDTEIANSTMKASLMMFSNLKSDGLEVEQE